MAERRNSNPKRILGFEALLGFGRKALTRRTFVGFYARCASPWVAYMSESTPTPARPADIDAEIIDLDYYRV